MLSTSLNLCKQFISTLLAINVSFIQQSPSSILNFLEESCPKLLEPLIDSSFLVQYLLGIKSKKIYHLTDRFLINYLILPFDNKLMIVGPYLNQEPTTDFCERVLNTNNLPISIFFPIQHYYHTLPISQNSVVISAISIAFKQLYGVDSRLDYTHQILFDKERTESLLCIPQDNRDFTMKLLEKRYEIENKLLLEIQHGNIASALDTQRDFISQVKGVTRSDDPIRSAKNLSYISNTLFRKAVERAAVHPIYIDILSSQIAHLIENTHSLEGLSDLRAQMVKDYCFLVKKHTLKNYTPLIRKAINYINVNLSTELHLKDIAEAIDVSPNYLSNLFNKETHQSITHFIHAKRIDKAIELLNTSELSIQSIAFYVGYSDMNYFTKLFKKQVGITPSHFKKQYKEHKSPSDT